MPVRPKAVFNSALVPFVAGYVRARGHDPEPLLARHAPETPTDGQPPSLTAAGFRALMDDASALLSDPLFGLHLALAMPRGAYGLLEFAVRSAASARVALEQLSRYGALINPGVRFWLEEDHGEVSLHHRLANDAEGVGRHGNLFTVARVVVMGREMIGPKLSPIRAWFAHAEGACPEELTDFLGTADVAFGRSSNGLSFQAKDLDHPLAGADPALNAVLQDHANRLMAELWPESTLERTRRAIAILLPGGEPSLADVAKKLHVSERTLQRRLTEDGLSFAQLLDEVRLSRAQHSLSASDEPLSEVAAQLGYRDAAAFGRAFKRWTGQSPGVFRQRVKAPR